MARVSHKPHTAPGRRTICGRDLASDFYARVMGGNPLPVVARA